jgi:hypothetical protein
LTTDKPQQAKDGEFDAAFIQPSKSLFLFYDMTCGLYLKLYIGKIYVYLDSNNSGQLFVIPNNNEETTINDPIIHVDDDSPSLLSSIHEEDSGAQAQKTMSKGIDTKHIIYGFILLYKYTKLSSYIF